MIQNFEFAHLELDPNKVLFAPDNEGIIVYEIFKDIPDYEGHYQSSSFGRIKSLKCNKEKILRQRKHKLYYRVNLYLNGKRKTLSVHKLLAMSFLNHRPKGTSLLVCDHIDNNPLNNRINNLQLITHRSNCSKRKKPGTSKYAGVSWSKNNNKWRSDIHINGVDKTIGIFNTEEEAFFAYKTALNSIAI